MSLPLLYQYEGEGEFKATGRFAQEADIQFVIGQRYRLAEIEERSIASHGHEFAWLKEAWQQLPEDVAEMYPSPEHLRKRALITAGWYDETLVDAGSNAAAIRVASAFRARSEFSYIIVRGPIVAIRDAKSQSYRAMKRADFQKSKSDIMEVIAAMIGIAPAELQRNAGMAA